MRAADTALWKSWHDRRDERAFEALVRPHLRFATAFARRLGCGDADADDVVQRALVGLATEPQDTPARVGVRAWLGRSVFSETRTLFRARSRRSSHEAKAARATSDTPDPLEVRDEVDRALATLAEGSRRAVELRFLYDLDYREIGHILGGSPLACRLRVHRAIARMRRVLGARAALLVVMRARSQGGAGPTDVSVAAAAAQGSMVAGLTGGIAMAMAWKLAGTAAGLALAAWVGWSAIRPAPDPRATGSSPEDAPTSIPGLAAAPSSLRQKVPATSDGPASPVSPPRPSPAVGAPLGVALDAPIPAGMGSVSGTIRFGDGTPLGNARVALWGSPQIVAETDATGRFHIHGDWVADRSLTLLGPSGYALELARVEMKADARVVRDVTLDRGFVLGARVTDAVSATPLADARVTLRRPGSHSENVMQAGFGMARTDAEGRFRFEFLPAASYWFSVQRPGYETLARNVDVGSSDESLDLRLLRARPLRVQFTGLSGDTAGTKCDLLIQGINGEYSQRGKGALDEAGGLQVDAPPLGDYHLLVFEGGALPRLEQDFHVGEGELPPIVLRVPSGARVTGTLRGPDGKVLAGTRLILGDAPSTKTDDQGRFTLDRASAGTQIAKIAFEDGTVRIGSVEIRASGSPDLDIRAAGSGVISATLVGSPIAALYPAAGGTDPRAIVAEARPDAKGRLRIPYLAAGAYRFVAMATDAESVERTVDLVTGQALDLGELRLVPFPVVPVTLTVPPGTRPPNRISVFPVDFVAPPTGGAGAAPASRHFGRVEFDGEARGWLKGLPAGDHRVLFSASGFAQSPPTSITVREGSTIPIQIELRTEPGK